MWTYFWKNLECELCKTAFPYEVAHRQRVLNVIEYQIPEHAQNSYLVLESISTNTSKVIHVVTMHKAVRLSIGRGPEANIRVSDISVSRLHATLFKHSNHFFYLSDNQSKFGTLALVRTPLRLRPGVRLQVQVSRTLLNIETISQPIKLCPCFKSAKRG